MGIIRSRWTIEVNEESNSQDSCHEVEKPLLKKRCLPFIGTTESETDGEKSESESESDSGDEEEEESSSVGDTDNTDNEQEEDDSSESESENGTERSHEEEALDLGRKEEQRKVVRSRAAIEEENEESESQESDSEVERPLVKQSCLPSVHIAQCNREEEQSLVKHSCVPSIDTPQCNKEEDDEDVQESESESDSDSDMQTTVANEEYVCKNHKQTVVVNEKEEGNTSKSESEGDSEGSNEHEALDFEEKEEQDKTMGIIRSRWTIEVNEESDSQESCHEDSQDSCHEVEKPLLKKRCLPFIGTTESEKDGEELESESDSGDEEENSSVGDTDNTDNEEEEDDSSESESENGTERSHEEEALDLGRKEEQGKVVRSRAAIEAENEESESQESDSEVEQPLVKQACLPSVHIPQCNKEKEQSLVKHPCVPSIDTPQCNKEEDDEAIEESESDSDSGKETESSSSRDTNSNHMQTTVANEKYVRKNHKQTVVENEKEEGDLSKLESEGDSEGNNEHETLDFEEKEEQGKTMGIIQSRWTIEVNEESDSQDSCDEDEKPLLKKRCLPFIDTTEDENPLLKKRCLPFIDTTEAEKDGEESESEFESESDSGEEEESSSAGDTDNNNKHTLLINEEEEDDTSESESENGTERRNEEEALDLGRKEEQGKVVRSRAAIEEEYEESESQESDSEVEQPLVKQSCLPSVHIPQCNKEKEQSLVKHSCVSSIDTPQCNKEEDDEAIEESESDSDSGKETESSSSRDTNSNHMQTTVANEKYVRKNHKQTVVENEKEEGNLSKSKSGGDSEGNNEHETLDFEEKEEQGKTMGIIRSRWTIEVNEESDSQESCHDDSKDSCLEVEKPLLKKRCLPFIGTTESEKNGEELESESESDSGDEEGRSSVGDTENTDNEEEEDDSSESESENGTERSHEEEALDLGRKEEQGKTMEVVQSIAAIEEENEEFESQESDSEVEQPLVKQSCLPSVHIPQCNKEEDDEAKEDSGEEKESSSSRDTDSNHRQTTVANGEYVSKKHKQTVAENEIEEGDLSKSESEGNSEGSNEHQALDFGEKEEQGKAIGVIHSKAAIATNVESESEKSFEVKQLSVKKSRLASSEISKDDMKENDEDDEESEVDSEEEEESSSFVNTSNNHKQNLVVKEEEENDSSESETEGDSEESNGHEDLDIGGEEDQGNVTQSESWMRMSQKKTKSVVSPKSYQADAMASETVSKSIADKKPLKANEGRNLYHRWSDDGVINLLEGMIEVKDRVGTGKSYISALCDIIGESSDFQHRAREKLRRLKALYKKNVGKPFKNFTSHEKRVFELSKIVWGIELGTKLSRENYNAEQSQHFQSNEILMGDHCSQARNVLKNGFDIIERFQSKSAFDERWIKLRLQEIQLYQEKLAIVKWYLDGVVDELHASLRSLQEALAD